MSVGNLKFFFCSLRLTSHLAWQILNSACPDVSMQQIHADGQLYRAIILLEIRIELGPPSESWKKIIFLGLFYNP